MKTKMTKEDLKLRIKRDVLCKDLLESGDNGLSRCPKCGGNEEQGAGTVEICSYRTTLSLNYRRSLSLNCSATCPSSGFQMPGVIPRHLEISRLLPVTAFRSRRCTEPYGRPPAASAAGRRTSGSCRTVG